MSSEDIIDVMSQGEAPVVARIYTKTGTVESRVEIGDVLEEIQKLQKETEFLKEYKSHRVVPIDEKISHIGQKVDTLREAILEYMKANKETKIDCPDIGAVTSRKTKGAFVIDDEDLLRKSLEKVGVFKDVSTESWKFDKKKLNKLLEEMKASSNMPAGAHQEQDDQSLAISFADAPKKAKPAVAAVAADPAEYDKLKF